MNYTVVDFREKETVVLTNDVRKELVYPGDIYTDAPMTEKIINGDTEALTMFLKRVKKMVPRDSKYHFLIPSEWVRMNCAVSDYDQSIDLDAALSKWKLQILDIDAADADNWLFDVPLLIQRYAKLNITACCVARSYIETLFASFMQAGIDVSVIEPSSVAILRSFDNWLKPYCFVEANSNSICITAHDPARGSFSMTDYYDVGKTSIADQLETLLPMFDYAARFTFENQDNLDLDIYLVVDGSVEVTSSIFADRVRMLPSSSRRIRAERFAFGKYAAAFGAAAKPLFEREAF